jgi:hypothetical protein
MTLALVYELLIAKWWRRTRTSCHASDLKLSSGYQPQSLLRKKQLYIPFYDFVSYSLAPINDIPLLLHDLIFPCNQR